MYLKGPFLSEGLVHEIVTLTVLILWVDVELMFISVTDPGAVNAKNKSRVHASFS